MGQPNPSFRPGTRREFVPPPSRVEEEFVPACPSEAYLPPVDPPAPKPVDPMVKAMMDEEDAKFLAAINKPLTPKYPIVRPADE